MGGGGGRLRTGGGAVDGAVVCGSTERLLASAMPSATCEALWLPSTPTASAAEDESTVRLWASAALVFDERLSTKKRDGGTSSAAADAFVPEAEGGEEELVIPSLVFVGSSVQPEHTTPAVPKPVTAEFSGLTKSCVEASSGEDDAADQPTADHRAERFIESVVLPCRMRFQLMRTPINSR